MPNQEKKDTLGWIFIFLLGVALYVVMVARPLKLIDRGADEQEDGQKCTEQQCGPR